MKHVLFILSALVSIVFFQTCELSAQVQEDWVARYSGPGLHDDRALKIGADAAGNVYVAGQGLYTNGPAIGWDYVVVKYSPSGNQLWSARYNGTNGNDYLADSVVDSAGNVYVTGRAELIGGVAFATVKFNSAGVLQWTALHRSQSFNSATAIKLDSSGNVYVAGFSFFPYEIWAIKYNNANGTPVWATRYDALAGNQNQPVFLDVDPAGNVYVAGVSTTNDPAGDYLTIKYDSNGNRVWSRLYGRPSLYTLDNPAAIAVAGSGDVLVTGSGGTIRYDSNGNQQWTSAWPGNALVLDAAGNAYTAGIRSEFFGGNVTAKYAPNGTRLWWSFYRETEGFASRQHFPAAIALDTTGNVYVTGHSGHTNTTFLTEMDDYTTIKYDTNGSQLWVAHFNGTNDVRADRASALTLDDSGNVYVTGVSAFGMGGWVEDFATVKYAQTTVPGVPRITVPPQHQSVIEGSNVTFTVEATGDSPLRYQWRANGHDLQNETNATLVITGVQSFQAGDYSVVVRNSLGMTVSPEAHLTVFLPPSIYQQPQGANVLAGGQIDLWVGVFGTEPQFFLWKFNGQEIPGANSYILTLTNIQPSQEGNYSVVVSNAYGTITVPMLL